MFNIGDCFEIFLLLTRLKIAVKQVLQHRSYVEVKSDGFEINLHHFLTHNEETVSLGKVSIILDGQALLSLVNQYTATLALSSMLNQHTTLICQLIHYYSGTALISLPTDYYTGTTLIA